MIDAATDKKKCRMFGTKLQMSLQITAKQLCERISIALENDRKKRKSIIAGIWNIVSNILRKMTGWVKSHIIHYFFLFGHLIFMIFLFMM